MRELKDEDAKNPRVPLWSQGDCSSQRKPTTECTLFFGREEEIKEDEAKEMRKIYCRMEVDIGS